MKKYLIIIAILSLIACTAKIIKDDMTSILGSYSIVENYEVIAGGSTGLKGVSFYTIDIVEEGNKIYIDNFANKYKIYINKNKNGDYDIPLQKFEYYSDSLGISGILKLENEILVLEYFAGGPMGQIENKCIGEKY